MSSIARQLKRRNSRLSLAAGLWTRGQGAPQKDGDGVIRSTARVYRGPAVLGLYNEIAALRLREGLEERREAKRKAKRERQPTETAKLRRGVIHDPVVAGSGLPVWRALEG